MSVLSIQVKGLDKVLKNLEKESKDKLDLVDAEMGASAEMIRLNASRNAPVNMGQLRSSISTKQSYLNKEVNVNAFYAPYVEFGTKTLTSVPAELQNYAIQFKGSSGRGGKLKDAIYKWAKQKGIDQKFWYIIYLRILKFGSRPHPFFFPAFSNERPKLLDRIKKVLK